MEGPVFEVGDFYHVADGGAVAAAVDGEGGVWEGHCVG